MGEPIDKGKKWAKYKVPDGPAWFYKEKLITEQGFLMLCLKHGLIPKFRSDVLKWSDMTLPPTSVTGIPLKKTHERGLGLKASQHIHEVNPPITHRMNVTKKMMDNLKVSARDRNIYTVLETNPAKYTVKNSIGVELRNGTVLASTGMEHFTQAVGGESLPTPLLRSVIESCQWQLTTPKANPGRQVVIKGDFEVKFHTKGTKKVFKSMFAAATQKLFFVDSPLVLNIETKSAKPSPSPTFLETATIKQSERYNIRIVAYDVTQWHPSYDVVKVKFTFRGDNAGDSDGIDKSKPVTEEQVEKDTADFFSFLMQFLARQGTLWKYSIQYDTEMINTQGVKMLASATGPGMVVAAVAGGVEGGKGSIGEKKEQGIIDTLATVVGERATGMLLSVRDWYTASKDLGEGFEAAGYYAGHSRSVGERVEAEVTHQDLNGKGEVKTPDPFAEKQGYFTTIGAILNVLLVLFWPDHVGDWDKQKGERAGLPGATKMSESDLDIWNQVFTQQQQEDAYFFLQRLIPYSLFKDPKGVFEEFKKHGGYTRDQGDTPEKAMVVGSKGRGGTIELAREFARKTGDDFTGILDVPVDGKLLRDFIFQIFTMGGHKSFRAFFEAIRNKLVVNCVQKSFTATSGKYFSQFYGASPAMNKMGSLNTHEGVNAYLAVTAKKAKKVGVSLDYEEFQERLWTHSTYKELIRKPKPKIVRREGLNIYYHAPVVDNTEVTEAFAKVIQGRKGDERRATTEELLKLRVFPLRLYGYGDDNDIDYRLLPKAKANIQLPIAFTKIDNKSAAEVKYAQADEAGKDVNIANFYQIKFTLLDILGWLPFTHRFYLPPDVLGLDSHAEDKLNMSGVYILEDVSYKYVNVDRLECYLKGTYDALMVQSLMSPDAAKDMKTANKLSKRDSADPHWNNADMKKERKKHGDFVVKERTTSTSATPQLAHRKAALRCFTPPKLAKGGNFERLHYDEPNTIYYCKHGIRRGKQPWWVAR